MSRDALVFYSPVDDARAWRAALEAELPDLDFRVDPDIGDAAEIRYALAWLPPKGFFARFPHLQLVTNLGAGVDALVRRDDLVPVKFSRLSDPGMVAMMTSYVVFAVTRYARDIPVFERAKRRGEWEYVHPRALSEIRVAVLGLGELGGPAARMLASMGFTVSGWSRGPKDIPGVASHTGRDGLERVLAENEIIVSLLPLTPDSRGLLGAAEFALMPKGAKFINASRGAVVDEAALIAALRSGQVGEATLDVFETEPLPQGHPFWSLDNVLITPHLASITVPKLAARDVAESIRRVRRGLPPLHEVDPGRGY
ncbi:glyoxylate/hydroxypyruvate reductase A [Ancylobacter dichloromethanicus]|uniref:Glyoxylate/hydroxypyruvate reductase A n=1 Tax=Ancylobacter dichloromethanicus TaxID=518825 RepID=A0A9W6N1C6_9HYPH|nr:glyoxylate/hydroxypyruvate reductase A [Ancylobacter dichloromethanicus]MBS7552168.1 glyoxylate/hydroxypyruvate reductase A [Ancylobacter dichloromethanicus]GLK73902.1 glyoxylate/hydroxypyruvate reductase A [Ancylobacter dichloromethanicus]